MSLFDPGGSSATVPPIPPPEPEMKIYQANNPNDRVLLGTDPDIQLIALSAGPLVTGFSMIAMNVNVNVEADSPQDLDFYFSVDQDPVFSPPSPPGPGSGVGTWIRCRCPVNNSKTCNFSWSTIITTAADQTWTFRLWMHTVQASPEAIFSVLAASNVGQGANIWLADPVTVA